MRQLTIKAVGRFSQNFTKRATCISDKDFFGINDVTSKDIAGCFSSPNKLSQEQRYDKYRPLLVDKHRPANEEKNKDHIFGRVRIDADNIPNSHGQFDPTKKEPAHDTISIKQTFTPNEGAKQENIETMKSDQTNSIDSVENETTPVVGNPAYKISEVKPIKEISDIFASFKVDDAIKVTSRYSNKPPLKFDFDSTPEDIHNVDGVYVRSRSRPFNRPPPRVVDVPTPEIVDSAEEVEPKKGSLEFRPQFLDDLEAKHGDGEPTQNQLDSMIEECNSELNQAFEDHSFDSSIDAKYDPKNRETPRSIALDYLRQVRSKKIEPVAKGLKSRLKETGRPYPLKPQIKLDSKGFRDYTTQVPDWTSMRHVELVEFIQRNIIYNNYDILALNKPYGIASHDEERKRESIDMNSLVGEIAKSMGFKKVYLAHRLDKFTTGVLLFSTSEERASNLNKLFKADIIKKTYWCITKGIPDPEAAIIDIPIAEFKTAGKVRSVPAPENVPEQYQLSKSYREARRAVTEYQVISNTNDVALVEVKPRSGVKHQIRCHLSFGMNTPILGDHKYSHFGSMAPQKLPTSTLKSLNLRQPKVRTLPMHLHAKSIVVPGAKANGETLFISAPMPAHFVENARSLKLRLP